MLQREVQTLLDNLLQFKVNPDLPITCRTFQPINQLVLIVPLPTQRQHVPLGMA